MEKFIATSFKVILAVGAVVALYILGSSIVYESGLFGHAKSVPVSFLVGDDKKDKGYEDKSVKTEAPVMFDSLDYKENKPQKQEVPITANPKDSKSAQNGKTEGSSLSKENKTSAKKEVTIASKAPVQRNSESASSQGATNRKSLGNETNVAQPVKNASNLRAKFEDLKKRFNYGVDANGVGWYVHKVWDVPELSRNTLICYINDEGEMYLASHYAGETPIAHTKARISAGGQQLTTADVSVSSPNYVRQSNGNKIFETVSYKVTKETSIIDMIAANANKDIQVTLMGNQNVDFALGEYDKEAVKDCKDLSMLLINYL